ncbi:twin-arginine translocation signal domain-containing protein [Natronorubrum halophilum]|uniref:twin-arginine translocation signal domain-containing protein n=1 Tax=Natronorubrum halophilum TaxID=1702106 RepID=UPI000EF6B889|nr:twin-arginine translocation signal domain-containing protein [Natronorubrum halophilum]
MSPPRRTDSTVTPSPPTHRSRPGHNLSRRTFIAAGGTAALVSMGGCTAVMDYFGDLALQDVNVFNGADTPVNGAIDIVDPNGDVVLEETFDLEKAADEDEENQDADSIALYEDIWTDAGDYEVSIELEGDAFDTELDVGETFQNDSNDTGTETNRTSENDSTDTGAETNRTSENDSNDAGTGIETESVNGSSDTGTVTIFDTEIVTVDDPEEEHLAVGLAREGSAELISFHVIENFSDLEDEFE